MRLWRRCNLPTAEMQRASRSCRRALWAGAMRTVQCYSTRGRSRTAPAVTRRSRIAPTSEAASPRDARIARIDCCGRSGHDACAPGLQRCTSGCRSLIRTRLGRGRGSSNLARLTPRLPTRPRGQKPTSRVSRLRAGGNAPPGATRSRSDIALDLRTDEPCARQLQKSAPTAKPNRTDAEAALHRHRSRMAPTTKHRTDSGAASHRQRSRIAPTAKRHRTLSHIARTGVEARCHAAWSGKGCSQSRGA